MPHAVIKVSRNTKKVYLGDSGLLPKSAPKPSPKWKVTQCGRRGFINGFPTRFYRLEDLATLWDQAKIGVIKSWYRQGLLPPPFSYYDNKYGYETPIWVTPQVRAIHLVLNEHWRVGHTRFLRTHQVTIDTLYDRGEYARLNIVERMNRASRKLHRRGIEWIDLPNTPVKKIDRSKKAIRRWDREVSFAIED